MPCLRFPTIYLSDVTVDIHGTCTSGKVEFHSKRNGCSYIVVQFLLLMPIKIPFPQFFHFQNQREWQPANLVDFAFT